MNFEAVKMMLDRGRDLVPDHMWDGVVKFYMQGWEPGGFLQAVMKNDLFGAFNRADSININNMYNWMLFFYNHTPSGSYGSEEKYDAWLAAVRSAIDKEKELDN